MNDLKVALHSIEEKLDRIEEKLTKRLSKTWLSITDVIQITGLSRSTINRAIKLGELKSTKNRGKRMIRREWVNRWIGG
jgi:excisionase family DNA binding protein